MKDKDVRRLKRIELLEILTQMADENEKLKARVRELETQLASRTIAMEKSGSIAEAALNLTRVFEEAQKAADLYLENIRAQGAQDITASALEYRRLISSLPAAVPEAAPVSQPSPEESLPDILLPVSVPEKAVPEEPAAPAQPLPLQPVIPAPNMQETPPSPPVQQPLFMPDDQEFIAMRKNRRGFFRR